MDEIDFCGCYRDVSPASLITIAPDQGMNSFGNKINYLSNYNGRYIYDNFHENIDLSSDDTYGSLLYKVSHITGYNHNFKESQYPKIVLEEYKTGVENSSFLRGDCSSNIIRHHDEVRKQQPLKDSFSVKPKGSSRPKTRFKRVLRFILPCFFRKAN